MTRVASHHQDLLRLNLVRGLGPVLARRGLEVFGSPDRLLGASAAALAQVEGVGRRRAERLRHSMDEDASPARLEQELEHLERLGARPLAFEDPDYPQLLRHIPDPPLLLYARGDLAEADALSVALVGSRRASAYGRDQAQRFAGYAATAGLTVVSGGARGIDAAAHRAALRAGGRTLAVLGSGLARPYPAEHTALFDEIATGGQGAVLSELPMTAGPRAEHFPRRNRIVSGLALGVLVVEAAARSGALITARLAAEAHGREVMALPGRIDTATSAGCHKAIREGWAGLVTTGAQMLEALGEAGELLRAELPEEAAEEAAAPAVAGEDATETAILAALDRPMPIEELAAAAGLEPARVQRALTLLELRGRVRRERGRYRRA